MIYRIAIIVFMYARHCRKEELDISYFWARIDKMNVPKDIAPTVGVAGYYGYCEDISLDDFDILIWNSATKAMCDTLAEI
jgi:hypothetical protein